MPCLNNLFNLFKTTSNYIIVLITQIGKNLDMLKSLVIFRGEQMLQFLHSSLSSVRSFFS